MKKLYDVIVEVASFPEIYLGKPSLERLYAFLGGFLHQNEQADDHCLDGFNDYVARKYRIQSDHNWSSIIQFYSLDERDAFKTFMKLFHEYCPRKPEG